MKYLFLVAAINEIRYCCNASIKKIHYELQISKIIGCGLTRIGDLGYDFNAGACGTFLFPEQRIILCFGYSGKSKCQSYDGILFHDHADSKNRHWETSLANIEGSPLAV